MLRKHNIQLIPIFDYLNHVEKTQYSIITISDYLNHVEKTDYSIDSNF